MNLDNGQVFGGEAQGDTITGFENILGSGLDDILSGTAGANFLSGFDGVDIISGVGGDDIIAGGTGSDELHGGDGVDTLDYSRSAGGST